MSFVDEPFVINASLRFSLRHMNHPGVFVLKLTIGILNGFARDANIYCFAGAGSRNVLEVETYH